MTIRVKGWFFILILTLVITDLAILLNIPFLRQILGFLFLTVLPGLLILRIFKLNEIDFLENILLTWGVSISFLMFFGLLINNLSLSLGYDTPLSTISLLILFNITFVILGIIGCKINKYSVFVLPDLNLSRSEKVLLIVPIFFPVLSVLGALLMQTTDNNAILMFLLFLIPSYVIFICIFSQKVTKRLYPVIIFLISISLLLIIMLRYPHIWGHDAHWEYYLFQRTFDNLQWNMAEMRDLLDACICVSVLPAIFQSIMNVTAHEYLFEGVYVSIFSFCPLVIYVLAKRYIGELYAFIASFFFVSQTDFLLTAASPRSSVAIFFVALAFMILFNDKIDLLKKRTLFLIFMLSTILSHYSTCYIFFFSLLISWIAMEIFSRRYMLKRSLTLTTISLFFACIFLWYSQLTEIPFNSGVRFIENTIINLNDLFISELRSEDVALLTGQKEILYIGRRVSFFLTWGTFILIGTGVLTMLLRYKEMITLPNVKCKRPDFLKTKFEMEYLLEVLVFAGLLVIMVTLPYISIGYSMNRLYSVAIILLSVCFIMGGVTLAKYFKLKPYLLILLILIPYSMCVTGALYQVCGGPYSPMLNSEGESFYRENIYDSESCGAKWLGEYGREKPGGPISVYSDNCGDFGLVSQGKILSVDSCTLVDHGECRGYIYLRYFGVVKGKLFGRRGTTYNITEYSDIFIESNKIYGNGGAEVYKV